MAPIREGGGTQAFGSVPAAAICRHPRLNQKGRAKIAVRVQREESQGVRLRRLGWEREEERKRLARAIKRNLFSSQLRWESDHGNSDHGKGWQDEQPESTSNCLNV
jgi:hypothetical protein